MCYYITNCISWAAGWGKSDTDSKKAGPREDEFPQGLPEQKGEDGQRAKRWRTMPSSTAAVPSMPNLAELSMM